MFAPLCSAAITGHSAPEGRSDVVRYCRGGRTVSPFRPAVLCTVVSNQRLMGLGPSHSCYRDAEAQDGARRRLASHSVCRVRSGYIRPLAHGQFFFDRVGPSLVLGGYFLFFGRANYLAFIGGLLWFCGRAGHRVLFRDIRRSPSWRHGPVQAGRRAGSRHARPRAAR